MTARVFRPRVEPVEAMQWTGTNRDEIEAWSGGAFTAFDYPHTSQFTGKTYTGILTPELGPGDIYVETGDWVVRDGDRFTKMRADQFTERYEPAADTAESGAGLAIS